MCDQILVVGYYYYAPALPLALTFAAGTCTAWLLCEGGPDLTPSGVKSASALVVAAVLIKLALPW